MTGQASGRTGCGPFSSFLEDSGRDSACSIYKVSGIVPGRSHAFTCMHDMAVLAAADDRQPSVPAWLFVEDR